jgi:hypothetical protein
MKDFSKNLSDMIMGLSPMTITIIVVLFIRLCDGVKDECGRGYDITITKKKKLLGWIIIVSLIQIWGLFYFMCN